MSDMYVYMYVCTHVCTKSFLKTTTNSSCVCTHLANKADSDSDIIFKLGPCKSCSSDFSEVPIKHGLVITSSIQLSEVVYRHFTFTFMHLADTFIQSDLQCIPAIHVLSLCVFPGNRTHNLLRC